MNAVGIDVSKGKSMMAALRPMGEVALLPQEFLHTAPGLDQMAHAILALGEDTRVVMEATGRYHEPVAAALSAYGIYVCILNPLYIKQSGAGSIRKVKTDKADSLKIAKYGLDNWVDLREHTAMDTIRQQLKLCSRQYNIYMKTEVSLQNNLISLTDKTFPGVNELFSSPARADGHQKWIDFVMTFWHCDCVFRISEKAFTARYEKWCKRKGYHFRAEKAAEIYAQSCELFVTLPKDDNTKLLITTAAQLMAEIGDVRRFPRRSSIVAFAGVDPAITQSGKHEVQSTATTKRGSPHLRKTLYQIVCTYLRKAPGDEPVYQFLDKKRGEGKPYFVYMTAAQNKFLRIYYARVKECLEAFDTQQNTVQD